MFRRPFTDIGRKRIGHCISGIETPRPPIKRSLDETRSAGTEKYTSEGWKVRLVLDKPEVRPLLTRHRG